ncbi:MAG: hypothetical protein IK111_02535 [Lachnospiraceae bacterium]|nr:hypothetical protein [Lachnospiraceae bacterium]
MKAAKVKGEWGYINDRRLKVAVITLFMYACAIGLFLFGLKLTNTRKNLYTILAVLSILPASKSMVNMIMFFRFTSLSREKFNEISNAAGSVPIIYELPFTTYEKTYFVESVACKGKSIACFYSIKPGKGISEEKIISKLKEHLETVLKNDGHSGFVVKIFTVKDDFLRRLHEMDDNNPGTDPVVDKSILNTFKSVSL